MISAPAVGIDLGGSNFRVGLYRLTGDSPERLNVLREPVGDDRSPDAVVARLAAAVSAVGGQTDSPVGIGFAGMLDPATGRVANSPHFGWRDVEFGALLRNTFGSRIALDNDVNFIALGESRFGAIRGAHSALCVFAGTGVGGALVVDGEIAPGATGVAGEIGHSKIVFSADARPCHCGQRGCVEAYVGGRCLSERAREELKTQKSLAIKLAGGAGNVCASHLDQAAAQGDSYACAVIAEVAPLFGAVLANAVTLINPSHLLLGGGMLENTPTLRTAAVEAMKRLANPPALTHLKIPLAELGDEAGLIGAAHAAASEAA